jgi:hypothetical protein
MKVKELIELLASFDPSAEVILQKDAEGNGYSPLSGAAHDAVYVADSTWSGLAYSTTWTATDACMTEDEWRKLMEKERCVILYPVN